jgi:tetratricopeptide (TPR) repeat protein
MRPRVRHLRALVVALALLLGAASAQGVGPDGGSAINATPALAELPKLQPITFPEPDPAARKELDRILDRLGSEDERSRADARNAIGEIAASIVPAVRQRLQDLRASLDREGAARVLEAARKAGRKAKQSKDEGKAGEGRKEKKDRTRKDDDGDDGDWLDLLLASPHPKDRAWQDLVHLYAMTRMLTAAGTTPAVREMIQLYAYFGDLVRVDLQRQVRKLRDKAVPALIEARQHDAKSVQKWANKELDVLGRAIPGEAVASNDPQILGDVLRAYGRTRDVDAARVILSFCNSDRVQLRDAARESLVAIGEPGIWQIRDQYLGLTGEKPPHGWTWDRIARELFALYDHQRLAEIHKLMDEGVAAAAGGNLTEAVDAFDKVLARAPLFERRSEMVPTYVDRARQLEDGHPVEALAMMRKALRLDPKGDRARSAEAEIACLEGELSIEQGAPDRTAFERALALDPGHERARKGLASLEDRAVERQSHLQRYAGAGAIGVAALIAMILLLRRRAPSPARPPPDAPAPSL